MEIRIVETDKRDYMDLLLLADEQESMIERYLDRGTLFVLCDGGEPRSVCVVTDEGYGVCELQNLATSEAYQRRGYGARLVAHACAHYRGRARRMVVGTGDSPMTVPFYERCGFVYTHRVPDYFVRHYEHPIFDAGVRLRHKVYFEKILGE